VSYAAGTSQYRTTGSSKMVQEVMGQKMDAEVTMSRLVTVDVAPRGGDTLAVTIRLDSLSSTMGAMPAPGLDALLGTTVVSLVSPAGVHYSHSIGDDKGNPAAEGIADELARVLPRVRGQLRAGASWTDTIADKGNQAGIDVDRVAIIVSTVAGEETFAGTKAWRINRTADVTISGSGTSQGQPMALEGVVKSSGAVFVTPTAYLGSTQSDEANMKVTMLANGMEVAITQSGTQTTERVR
jgi:hypothetical protein